MSRMAPAIVVKSATVIGCPTSFPRPSGSVVASEAFCGALVNQVVVSRLRCIGNDVDRAKRTIDRFIPMGSSSHDRRSCPGFYADSVCPRFEIECIARTARHKTRAAWPGRGAGCPRRMISYEHDSSHRSVKNLTVAAPHVQRFSPRRPGAINSFEELRGSPNETCDALRLQAAWRVLFAREFLS